MKKRATIRKAEWSIKREEEYRNDCDEILLKNDNELQIDGNDIYLKSGDEKKLLITIDKPKSMWYEIWLKLKYP